jgi:hypothetical protein
MTTLGKLETSDNSIFGEELNQSSTYRILGLVNGLLLGLALALGAWGISGYAQSSLPVRMPVTGFVLAAVLVLTFAGTAGWLTARLSKGWFTVVAWLVTAVLIALVIGYETSHIRTFLVWLADGRFRGLPIYPLPVGSLLPIVIAGFFIMLVLGVLAFAQDYRLEAAHSRLGARGGISFSTLLFLSLPLPIVILAGFITNNMVGGANATFAIQLVDEAFRTGRTYEGDLFELSLEQGVNYNAIKGVQDMMSANYTLGIAGFDAANSTVIVSADFDNGAWISCRVVNEQLGFCSDASPPYTIGFASLIAGQEIPEDCTGCRVRVSEQWQSWLSDRAARFGSNPQVEKVVQWGAYTLIRIQSSQGDYTAQCWFHTVNVIEVDKCEEITAE